MAILLPRLLTAIDGRFWLRRRWLVVVLSAIVAWYGLATLPGLDDFPLIGRDEAQIAAPAYKLASQGVYGQDMYTGYYRSEQYVYEFMPVHPLLLALSFKLLGLGVWQARLVSVLCGLATVLLIFALGRRLYGSAVGLLAAAALCVARLSLEPQSSGVPLLDQARLIRYDIVVPMWVLSSCLCFHQAHRRDARLGYVAAGALAGVATLSHVYGAFILAVLALALLWQDGWRLLRAAPVYLLALGWLLALLPWLIYASQDPAAYYGQTLWDQAAGRFDLLSPAFYWDNLIHEPRRYLRLIGGQSGSLLQPRVGIWLLLAGVLATNILLWRRARRGGLSMSDRLLLLGPVVLGGLLGLLVNEKKPDYIILVLPFLALQCAFAAGAAWRWAGTWRLGRWLYAAVLLAALLESGAGIAQSLRAARAASSYEGFTRAVARSIPPGARVLAVHNYWIGLAQLDMRSLDLPFRFTNPNYYKPRALSMEQALEQVAPAYVLIDPQIEEHVLAPIRPAENEMLGRQKADFTQSVHRHCPTIVATIEGPEYADYGPMKVYRCAWQR